MRVALICKDKPGQLQTRLDNRSAHLANIETSGVVEMVVQCLNDGAMTGSLVILNVESLPDAQAWADADPYAKAGLFESVMISEWKKVIG